MAPFCSLGLLKDFGWKRTVVIILPVFSVVITTVENYLLAALVHNASRKDGWLTEKVGFNEFAFLILSDHMLTVVDPLRMTG